MLAPAGLPDWLFDAGQGLVVVFFLGFFYLVIRLWLHLADSGSAYNSAQSIEAQWGDETGSSPGAERQSADQGKRA